MFPPEKFLRFACGLACLFGAGRAAAQAEPARTPADAAPTHAGSQAFRVEFTSSTRCQDTHEFTRKLRAFTPRARPATPGEPALTFVVQLVPTEAGVGGRLTLREPDGRETFLREVPTPNCHDVIEGMALIAALTIDPLAIIPHHSMPGDNTPPVERQPLHQLEHAPVEADEPSPWQLAFGVRAEGHTALTPDPALGGSAFASVAYAADPIVQPSLRLGAHFARSVADGFEGGEAEFNWWAARLAACPIRWALGASLGVRPCAFGDAGQLSVNDAAVLWSAAGLELELEAELGSLVRLGAEAGVFTPFRRDLFFFGPSEAVHRVPAVGVTASVGLGLRFF